MRGLRSTIALLVVLAALSAYIYFVTWKKTDTDTGSKLEKVFAALETDKIDEIKVKSESGETTTLRKVSGTWQITAPVSDNVEEAEVSALASTLGSLEVSRVIDENPADLKEYGLTSPRIEVDFKAPGEKDYRRLIIGEKSPTGVQLFATRNAEKRVFLIPGFQETVFNRSTFDLRDKRLLKFDREKADGLEITPVAGTPLQIRKDGNDWKITRPVQGKADYGSVEGLIGRLQTARMKSLVAGAASPADLRKYGLDKPAVTVNVSEGSSRATLLVGGKADDNTFYARDASKPAVFTVDGALADDLKKGADDYRRKDLFEMRAFNASRIELNRDGQSIVLEMTKGAGDNPGKWRRLSPNPADLERDKTEAFLTKLSNLRATSFVESSTKTGLDKPTLTVLARYDDTKEDRVHFGKVNNDVYAAHPGEPGVAKIDALDFTDTLKALDEVAK